MLRPSAGETLRAWLLSALVVHGAVAGNPDAKRLYDDLLSNYNKLVRPVVNTSDVLRVCIKLKLSQLIDVLPVSATNPYDEEICRKTEMKSKRGILSIWNSDRMSGDPDANDTGGGRLFPYVPYVKTYKGIHSSMTESFFSKHLERKLSKMSFLDDRGRKSKVSSNSLEIESTGRKHLRGPHTLKPKRKSRKVNRSRKYRNVDSTREFKKMLENFRFISEEELGQASLDSKGAKNIVPAYFVLKLAPNSGENVGRSDRYSRSNCFKLVFANDDSEEKFLNRLNPSVEMKDKINQTSDLDEAPTLENRPQDTKLVDKETMVDFFTWSKMDQEFRFQREFNAGLLGQMQNLLAQLTTVTELLNDLFRNRTDSGNINQFLQDLAKKRHSSEESTKLNLCLTDFECGYQIHKELNPAFIDAALNEVYGSATVFKNEFDDESAVFSPGNYDVFPSIRDVSDPIRETRRRRNIESTAFDAKSKCSCQSKHHERRKGNALTFPRNSNRGNLKKTLLEQTVYVNKRAEEDLKIGRTDLKEDEDEDADYDESCDEMGDNCDKKRMKKYAKADTSRSSTIMKRLREDQLRLCLDEGDEEFNENDVLIFANEDPTIKFSSRASSRRNLKNQIMTTNLWVEQSWYDYKLRWDPKEYGGVHMLHVPSDHIWRPDIVLYNNADGNYEVTLMTKARVSHTGLVEWQPPAVYKSSCAIDVEFFPYDIQTCVLKLGSWTYDGFKVDLRHMDEKAGSNVVEVGVDLSEFYMSVEWDILEVPAVRNEKFYTCCDEPYLDITFNITMRRKTLFYTVNIIIPCMGISFLTVLTFYLPSDSGEKVTLSISILISLHVFFLLVVEIIPPTSLVVPLLGKYLIFAMILVSISICVTVVVLNVHFRSPQTHRMAPWVKRVFIHILPRLLVMRRPQYHFEPHRFMSRRVIMQTVKGKEIQTSYYPYPYQASAPAEKPKMRDIDSIITRQRALSKEDFSPESLADGEPVFGGSCQIHGPPPQSESEELSLSGVEGGINDGEDLKSPTIKNPAFSHSMCPPEVHKSCFCVRFIAEHTKMLEDSTKVKEDWKYVAMVLDRLFLWIFTLAVLVGTAGIILQAPTLYDDRIPIDKQFAEIQTSTVIRCPPQ